MRADPVATAAPWLVALACSLAAILAIEPFPVGVFQDDGVYAILAKSLASGEGYRYLNIPGAPSATHYPPGYPAFLALLWKLYPAFPQNVTLFKFANAVLLGVAGIGFYRLARRHLALGATSAAVGVAAFTACAPVVLLTVMVLSEPLFLALLAPTLMGCERATASGRVRDAAIAALLVAALAMVRTVGVMAAPATMLVLVWRRQWRPALAMGGIVALALLPWQLWVAAHANDVPAVYLGKYGSYLGWLADAVDRRGVQFLADVAWTNLHSLVAQGWATTATDTLSSWVRNPAAFALAFFFGMGLAALGRRAPSVALFMAFYLVTVVVWPFAPARFTWGIWPLVGLAFTMAATTASTWSAQVPRMVALAALALLAIGYGAYNWLGASRSWWTHVQAGVANRARDAASWIVANTPPDAVVATDDDVLIHLYTGRRAIPNGAFTPDEHLVRQTPAVAGASLRRILGTYQVDYVLASSDYGAFATQALLDASPRELRLVRPLPQGGVFAPVRRATGGVTP